MGKAHDRKWLASLHIKANDLGVYDIISFEEGFRDSQAFDAAIQAAGVVLLPYRRIAMSAVLASAIANGSPTVMSDLPPLREYTRDQGLYFKNGDSSSLADVLDKIWQNPIYIADNAKLFGELKSLYSTERIAKRTADIYRKLKS